MIKGNDLKRKGYEYQLDDDRRFFDDIKSTFTQDLFARNAGSGVADETPIFILGMPRSGTTLVEQIISSHSQVFGAGELPELSLFVTEKCKSTDSGGYPQAIAGLGNEAFAELAIRYIEALRRKAPGSGGITDKMPHNFLYLGMIWLMLPKAKVIHCRRSPMDTCLSIFKQDFKSLHKYAYNLEELGGYYLLYLDLMKHWRAVLPEGFIHEVTYEELVADQEGESRCLLQFCGLPWEENCLRFHAAERAVKTASVAQVRKKIYTDSVALWRHYDDRLEPLTRILYDNDLMPRDL